MSSSKNTESTTQQINNYKHDNNAGISVVACNSLEQQKDSILNNMNSEKAWVKVSQNASVKLKRDTPVMESTFRID